jgi:hypothetical protein
MTEPYKVTIKIGDAEFSAEGDKATVDAQFQAFLTALAAVGAVSKGPAPTPAQETPGEAQADNPSLNDDQLTKAFIDGKDSVSMNILPQSQSKAADTLLLLLYGYLHLKDQDMVLGGDLIEAARQSGITLDRVDRTIAKHSSLLRRSGQRKGAKYGLNNQGIIKAKEMLTAMLAA